MYRIDRRELMLGGLAAAGSLCAARCSSAHAPRATVLQTKVISRQPHLYKGWPTIARRKCGELLAVWSGGREAHVCPFGQVKMMRTSDEGKNWSWPCVLMDSPIDDRDAGVLETAKGTILVTTFTSLAYEPTLDRAEKTPPGTAGAWATNRLQRWRSAHRRVSADHRQAALGVWMIRSTDGGVTWSGRYDCRVDSPHGPIQLADGRLLYAGKELWAGERRVGVCQSTDDGKSWQWLAAIPVRDGDLVKDYHELHAAECADGRIVVQIRNHNKANRGETLQCQSADGGKTWSVPRPIGVWGLPSHLLRLDDDRLLMTYGHRRSPFGNQARVSNDHGGTWSEPILISADGTGGDLGYPSTVQLSDGTLLTIWYEKLKDAAAAVLRQAHWKLE